MATRHRRGAAGAATVGDPLLARLFHGSREALALLGGPDIAVLDVNAAFCAAAGIRRDDVLGRPAAEALALERAPALRVAVERAAAGRPWPTAEVPTGDGGRASVEPVATDGPTAVLLRLPAADAAAAPRAVLQAVGEALAGARSAADGLPAALAEAADRLGYDLATLWRVRTGRRDVRLAAAARGAGAAWADAAAAPLGSGPLGRVAAGGAPEWLDRGGAAALRALGGPRGLAGGAAAPVRVGDRVGAVVLLQSRRAEAGDTAALAAVEAVAGEIGRFLERVRVEEALRASERRRGRLLASLLQGEGCERRRIAEDLHDDTIQVMTASLLAIDRARGLARRGQVDRIDGVLERVRETLAEATERTRRLQFELRPPLLEERGLAAAMAELVDQTAQEAGFEPVVAVTASRFTAPVEELVYRTFQELLANVRKHAAARRVEVTLVERDGSLHGAVVDDGIGFSPREALDRSRMRLHLGLDATLERVRVAGGAVRIRSEPGRGAAIRFRIPADLAERAA